MAIATRNVEQEVTFGRTDAKGMPQRDHLGSVLHLHAGSVKHIENPKQIAAWLVLDS